MPNDGTYNERFADDTIRHRLALLRYETGTTERLLKAYSDAFRDVDRELERIRKKIESGASRDTLKLERLIELRADLDRRSRDLYRIAKLTLDERLAEVARAELSFIDGHILEPLGVSLNMAAEPGALIAITEPIGGNIWTNRLAMDLLHHNEGLQDIMGRMIAQGASMPRIAELIGKATTIRETYRNRFVAIARTEVQRVSNTVALRTYGENLDVIGGVQWLGTLDSRTCLLCAPHHNKVYRYGKDGRLPSFQQPPLHPRCRCFVSPITRSWQEIGVNVPTGTREMWTSRPFLDTTFPAWLRRQKRETQLEVFGSARKLDAWRGNRLPIEAFSDGFPIYKVLNLGELQRRYPGRI